MESDVLEGEDLLLWREFLRWNQVIHAAVNRAVATSADLSVPEFEVLTRLWSDPEHKISQHRLAGALGWSASRASHLLHRLEGRGFIAREDVGQGRAREVRLTDEGHARLLRAFGAHGAAFRKMLIDRLAGDERRMLLALMARTPES